MFKSCPWVDLQICISLNLSLSLSLSPTVPLHYTYSTPTVPLQYTYPCPNYLKTGMGGFFDLLNLMEGCIFIPGATESSALIFIIA